MFKTLSSLLSTFFFFAVIAVVVIITSLWQYAGELPDYHQLEKYEPAVTTRLFAGDGQLLMEYAAEKRIFVPVDKIPDRVKNAFIAAEDKKFYSHAGIDFVGIIRAILGNLKNIGSGRRPAGASTITQQVAKNFLLSSELSYVRKIKEAILATRMEQAFTKDHILELYLNEIYLGNRSYGVAAAALNYFGKPLNELTLEETAYLAALPKGPNNYNPKTKYEAAVGRRNWVIDRMVEDEYVTPDEAEAAKQKPLTTVERNAGFVKNAQYFSEEVRREISAKFGADALYEGGLIVRTTLDPKLQEIATRVFHQELKNYDLRHGWRGALGNIPLTDAYKDELKNAKVPAGAEPEWKKAVVLQVKADEAVIETEDGSQGIIPLSLLSWARKSLNKQDVGAAPRAVTEVLNEGDIIFAEPASEKDKTSKKLADNAYQLRQLPNVEGALIVMDPHTGKVLAVVGGYSFAKSQFNRATQAYRQTGSSFKPFVYLTALENGYSPTDLILDAPFVLDQGAGQKRWKPENYSKKFYGLMTLREGIEKSRNLMTVRLAQDIGMDKVSEMSRRIGVNKNLPKLLSMSLGAGDTRLIDMASAYSVLVNGGKKVEPYFIERIQDRNGKTIYKRDHRECVDCNADKWDNQNIPHLSDTREQIVDPLSAYQMTSILEGVAQRGTGARLRWLNRHLAGKTGTTNDNKDSWFMGFSPDLVVGTYIGFDEPRTLGRRETGASAALPIFYSFMEEALKNQPDIPFRIPKGIKLVRINNKTGKAATPSDTSVIFEALKPDFDFNKNKQRVIGEENKPAHSLEDTAKVFGVDEGNDFQLGTEY
ncbi:MAG: penicillin-binding protein 1A [Alphaproteobacteria bacterium]|nr:penicillin-binding protein 1A [Alphaproteobacteria bacterium]